MIHESDREYLPWIGNNMPRRLIGVLINNFCDTPQKAYDLLGAMSKGFVQNAGNRTFDDLVEILRPFFPDTVFPKYRFKRPKPVKPYHEPGTSIYLRSGDLDILIKLTSGELQRILEEGKTRLR